MRRFIGKSEALKSITVTISDEDESEYMTRVLNSDHLRHLFETRAERQVPWRKKLFHGYANRKFGERITSLMHRAGEELDFPAYIPNFAEKSPMSEDDIRRLAQHLSAAEALNQLWFI